MSQRSKLHILLMETYAGSARKYAANLCVRYQSAECADAFTVAAAVRRVEQHTHVCTVDRARKLARNICALPTGGSCVCACALLSDAEPASPNQPHGITARAK